MRYNFLATMLIVLCIAVGVFMHPYAAVADSAAEIDREVKNALDELYAEFVEAKEMYKKAKGVLVFPEIVKGGFIVGGHYGEGALLKDGNTVGYYNTVQGSYGLQASRC